MNIIYIGANGFPFGLATIQRQILISKGIIYSGNSCKVISRYGTSNDAGSLRKGLYDNLIPYECAAPKSYRPKGLFARNTNKLLGSLNEVRLIYKNRKKGSLNVMLGIRSSFAKTLYYRIISFLFGFKYIIDVNELLGLEDGRFKLNDYLFNMFSSRLCDGMILISDYLIEFHNERNRNLKFVKAPIICDIKSIENLACIEVDFDYFLYCSSVTYMESIIFVIDAFLKVEKRVELKLIVSGDKREIDKLQCYIKSTSKADIITVESNIPYINLISYYKNAKGLLIPLPETTQHRARFPHKIGEYISSKRPIISNKWGEVSNYFDETNAFLAERYDVDEYAKQMNKCLEKENNEIILKAYLVGLNHFDYPVISRKIIELIQNV